MTLHFHSCLNENFLKNIDACLYCLSINHMLKYEGLIDWFSPPVSLSCEERDDQVQAAQQRAGQDMEAGWCRQGRSVKYFSFSVSSD
jgi:hypothetical protein